MSKQTMFSLLQEIGFTRPSGTKEELACAKILQREIEKVGYSSCLQSFEVNDGKVLKVSLVDDLGNNYEVSGYLCSESTPDEGITAPFYYMEGFDEVDIANAKGKIVLINGFLNLEAYKAITKAQAVGFISYSGDVYDTLENNDLAIKELREPLWELGKLPGVHMRTKTALDLVKVKPLTLTMIVKGQIEKTTSQNIIVEIPGTTKSDEVVVFTAHYDSVLFSKGVYDNGAGSVIIMEIFKDFTKINPSRTLRFIWCGSEERGLLGSKYYVSTLSETELNRIKLNINIDVGATVLGRDSAIILAEDGLVEMVKYLSKEIAFSLLVKQDIYSSDCIPFANRGVPSINFMRFGFNGAAHIHDRYDTMFFLSEDALNHTYEFAKNFTDRLLSYEVFPVSKIIPDKIKEKVDNYLGKKKA